MPTPSTVAPRRPPWGWSCADAVQAATSGGSGTSTSRRKSSHISASASNAARRSRSGSRPAAANRSQPRAESSDTERRCRAQHPFSGQRQERHIDRAAVDPIHIEGELLPRFRWPETGHHHTDDGLHDPRQHLPVGRLAGAGTRPHRDRRQRPRQRDTVSVSDQRHPPSADDRRADRLLRRRFPDHRVPHRTRVHTGDRAAVADRRH